MDIFKIEDMVKGWFIGNFEPSLYKTDNVEIGLKQYSAGDSEDSHYHKIATEFTVIINGLVEMNGNKYQDGDIIVVKPGESTDFKALTDVKTLVVKLPGALNDKYTTNE